MAYPLLLYFVFGPSVVGAALFRNTIRLRVRSFCTHIILFTDFSNKI